MWLAPSRVSLRPAGVAQGVGISSAANGSGPETNIDEEFHEASS
jgi:hypothetical protein